MRLAFNNAAAIGGNRRTVRFRVGRPDGAVLALHLGADVLLCGDDGSGFALTQGRLIELGADPAEPDRLVARVERGWPLVLPQDAPSSVVGPGQVWAELAPEVEALFAGLGAGESLGEAVQAGFAPPDADIRAAVYHAVLHRAGGQCELTGRSAAGIAANDPPAVVAIRPLEAGGPLHVANFLALSPRAAEAFEGLAVTLGDGLEIVVDTSRADPELVEALNPLGRLAAGGGGVERPDPAHLAWHRERFFARLGASPW